MGIEPTYTSVAVMRMTILPPDLTIPPHIPIHQYLALYLLPPPNHTTYLYYHYTHLDYLYHYTHLDYLHYHTHLDYLHYHHYKPPQCHYTYL